MFTHYSLFKNGNIVEDFEKLPAGGLPELLASIHTKVATDIPNSCLSITRGTLHPHGQQMSFGVGRNGAEQFCVILMTSECVHEHAIELSHEGNVDSAEKARKALVNG